MKRYARKVADWCAEREAALAAYLFAATIFVMVAVFARLWVRMVFGV